jgi:preprotein translocase SecE subunit
MLQYVPVKATLHYFKEARAELSKVVWTKPLEVTKLTLTVLVITLIIGLYLGGLDLASAKLIEALISTTN